ncbi:MAG TPA: ribose 5-phosphate isomerase A [Candidatus Latescibacteria bacterium]|jgi:ribose 5-phosphate isomerase A|nr:ribose 5-phosphate isomerase A [Candidatus Latescibacterota bacterium]|tara:strand:+ start:168 stop:863 length:696 start_codon:yes stop_codon:yes gene_type:complete
MSDHKELAARRAVEYIQDGMVVGLGTGSTAEFAIRALGDRVQEEGLEIRCVPTSESSAALGEQLGLDIQTLEDNPAIDLTIDGADEVDPDLELIKGLGGALLREKIVAAASSLEIIIVDPGKLVDRLGTRAPLPVEVIPFAWGLAKLRLLDLCQRAELRLGDDGERFVTDNGNFILDCHFPNGIGDAGSLDRTIDEIPGVVENGLFVGLTDIVVVGLDDGQCRVMARSGSQ